MMWKKSNKEKGEDVPGELHRYQRLLADWIGSNWEKIDRSKRKVLMVLFGLFSTGYLIGLMLGVIGEPMQMPDRIARPVSERRSDAALPVGAREHIARFRELMDSLGTSASGRAIRDSILRKHPGILDTIAQLELFIEPLNKTENEKTRFKK